MVLDTEAGLSPGDLAVLDGDTNGWMHQDATWYGARPQPRGLCVRWGPRPLQKKGAEPPQIFRPYLLFLVVHP